MTQPESPGDGRRAPLPPELRTFRCESALPDPSEAQSSAKTLDGSLPGRRSEAVLNEKDAPPQRQKLVRQADLFQGRDPSPSLRAQRSNPLPQQERKMDCFAALAMTLMHTGPTNTFAPAAQCARGFAVVRALWKSEGAGKTGCALHPRSHVQTRATKTHMSIQVQRGTPGLPCAMA